MIFRNALVDIKKGLGKHCYSLLLSSLWAILGAAAFWFVCQMLFPDLFVANRAEDQWLLLHGSWAVFVAIGLLMISTRRFPYGNSWETLFSVCLSTTVALLCVLAATRSFYSGSYLFALLLFTFFWFGLEVYYRSRYVEYVFVLFPSPFLLSERDFPEQRVIFAEDPAGVDWREADAVIVDPDADMGEEWIEAAARARALGVPVLPLPRFLEAAWGRVPLETLHRMPVADVDGYGWYGLVKPALEWLAAAAAFVATSPIMLAIAVMVKATCRGPILFRQERVGRGGRAFTIYKFRTMHEGAEAGGGETRRLTPVGGFLRKYHLDELPQLLNVLKGEMAIVGPRPETSELTEWYKREIPGYALRTMVKQGIVSWALIHQGNVSGVADTAIKLSYDLYYIKHASALLDLYIALKAVWFVVIGVETLREPPTLSVFPKIRRRRR